MSRILLMVVVILWLSRPNGAPFWPGLDANVGLGIFLGGFALLVLFMGVWSRVLIGALRRGNLHRTLHQFQKSMGIARLLVPIWFGVGVFALSWPGRVDQWLGPIHRWPIELPGMLLGTAPAVLAWVALTWAAYPADRSLREQTLFYYLDEDLPIHAPPSFPAYFAATFRLQVLFTLVPIVLILLLRDAMTVALDFAFDAGAPGSAGATLIELAPMLIAIFAVVLLIPEILRRVLATERLPDSPLRRRLDELCQRTGLRYRDILLWKTNHHLGNAAVMGLIPQVRYILLSDVLLETMTDRQIEAVFAHELGHVKHWHLGWYVVLVKTMVLLSLGPGQFLLGVLLRGPHPAWLTPDMVDLIGSVAGFAGFIAAFGFISRWFERQADLFAARTMEPGNLSPTVDVSSTVRHVTVGGAAVFASALQRVALVNNIPIAARNFTHGSIAERMNYLQELSMNPTRVSQFDRSMGWLYTLLGAALLTGGIWVAIAAMS